jgi:hypothetical protein
VRIGANSLKAPQNLDTIIDRDEVPHHEAPAGFTDVETR